VGAVIVEPVQGAAGFVVPPAGFLPGLRETCRRLDMLFLADEIQVGLGRTGTMLALEHFGIDDPDVLLLSKSLAGGNWPLSAVVARADVFASAGTARTTLGETFSHNALGCGLALEVLDILEQTDVLADARGRGAELLAALGPLADHPHVARAQGLGAALSVQLTGPAPRRLARRVVQAALDEHLLLYAAGVAGDRVKLAPPLTITPAETIEAARRVRGAFAAALTNP
jgi:acetylornithine/succinyldiaminopimelate/putrescine aminotransferase